MVFFSILIFFENRIELSNEEIPTLDRFEKGREKFSRRSTNCQVEVFETMDEHNQQ